MRKLPTVIEAQALAHDPVYLNGGQRGLQMRLKPLYVLGLLNAISVLVVA